MSRPSDVVMRQSRTKHKVHLAVSLAALLLAYGIILIDLLVAHGAVYRLTLLGLAAFSALASLSAAMRANAWYAVATKGTTALKAASAATENQDGAWDAPQVGPGKAPFRGRSSDLDELLNLYQRAAQSRMKAYARDLDGVRGPIIILVHGMPGVGKSAIAGELVQRLRREFERVIYTSFSDRAGGSRTLSQVLRSIGREVGSVTIDPISVLRGMRSATAESKDIFIFDEAEDPEFVKAVLPSGNQNLVIVTSRRNIGPSLGVQSYYSYFLDALTETDAFAVWQVYSRTDETAYLAESTELIEICGRLPLALRSAADHLSESVTPRELVAALRREDTRLDLLSRYGWNLRRAIESEYERLIPREQTALRRLSAIKSASFVPWALTGLISGISQREAEGILAQLNSAKLIDSVAQDQRFRLDRYQFHPLVRLFAQEKLVEAETNDAIQGIQQRLAGLYSLAVDAVLSQTDSGYRARPDELPKYLGDLPGPEMSRWIASIPDQWIRAESGTLIDVVELAYRTGKFEMCRTLAVRVARTLSHSEQGTEY